MADQTWTANLWSAHPDSGEDACDTGIDGTRDEVMEWLATGYGARANDGTRWLEIIEPDGARTIANPVKQRRTDPDDNWRHEMAMEAGMAFGCDGYNSVMGWE